LFNLDACDNFTRRHVGKLRLMAETYVVGRCSNAFVYECLFVWKFFYG